MKKCSKCGIEKDWSEFHRNRSCKDGLNYWCKICAAKYARSPEGKAAYKKYGRSPKRKKSKKKWNQSDVGKESKRKSGAKSYSSIRGYLQSVFSSMKRRCENPDDPAYKWYGGRGIRVCFKSSDEFIDYVVNELKVDPRGFDIDRIDNNDDYKPGNIRFVTHKENCNNKSNNKEVG